jgi:hypothetical protein
LLAMSHPGRHGPKNVVDNNQHTSTVKRSKVYEKINKG